MVLGFLSFLPSTTGRLRGDQYGCSSHRLAPAVIRRRNFGPTAITTRQTDKNKEAINSLFGSASHFFLSRNIPLGRSTPPVLAPALRNSSSDADDVIALADTAGWTVSAGCSARSMQYVCEENDRFVGLGRVALGKHSTTASPPRPAPLPPGSVKTEHDRIEI